MSTNIQTGTWQRGCFREQPSLADTLRLYPQDKTILAHLERGKPITPMKAMTIYGFTRLAAQIHRIRKAGYKVEMTLRRDEREHQYAEYRLAA